MTGKPDIDSLHKPKPNPFDPEALRLSEDETGDIDVEPLLTVVEVRKPKRDEFVRVHPDHHAVMPIIEVDRDVYLVDPSMRDELAGEWTPADVRVAVNRDGTPFLWPVKQPKAGDRQTGWHASGKAVAVAAEMDWVAEASRVVLGGFELSSDAKVVRWPDRYVDEKGGEMFQRVMRLLDQFEARDVPHQRVAA